MKGREYTFPSTATSNLHCTKSCTKPLAQLQAAGVSNNGLMLFYLLFFYFSMVYPTPQMFLMNRGFWASSPIFSRR